MLCFAGQTVAVTCDYGETTPGLKQGRDPIVAMAMRASSESSYSFLSTAMLDPTEEDDDDEVY
jgi:hypothetical protein